MNRIHRIHLSILALLIIIIMIVIINTTAGFTSKQHSVGLCTHWYAKLITYL